MSGSYDIALICLNGHVISASLIGNQQDLVNHCTQCGAKAIAHCPACQKPIRGEDTYPGVINYGHDDYVRPAYCHECGMPYPWTEAYIQAAVELINMSGINDGEKNSLKSDLPHLLVDTPRTKVATTRMKLFLKAAGKDVSAAMREILVDVVSEGIKKALFQ